MCVNNRKAELARQSSTADQEVTDVREYIGNAQQLKHWMYVTNGLYMCMYVSSLSPLVDLCLTKRSLNLH